MGFTRFVDIGIIVLEKMDKQNGKWRYSKDHNVERFFTSSNIFQKYWKLLRENEQYRQMKKEFMPLVGGVTTREDIWKKKKEKWNDFVIHKTKTLLYQDQR